MGEYCKKQRREATMACLQRLHEHINAYMKENLMVHSLEFSLGHHDHDNGHDYRYHHCHRVVLPQFDGDYEIIYHDDYFKGGAPLSFSYQCHPENASRRKGNSTE